MNQKESNTEIQKQKRHFEKKQRKLALSKSTDYMMDDNLNQFLELYNKKDELNETEKKEYFKQKNKLTEAYISQYRLLTQGWQTQKQEKLQNGKGDNKIIQYKKKHILDE
ncbi:unnamed protein product [Paramecium sonneborni]|uniref:Uncharacterized protein n=1 Tax=Paramecium sonneborni TaxID=65129 RepID=A0A8S1P2N8_9CILI|nr:unnamed protein product [Paramecium sonneborni]